MAAMLRQADLVPAKADVRSEGQPSEPHPKEQESPDTMAGPSPGFQSVRRLAYQVARYVPLFLMFAIWELVSRSSPTTALLLPAPTTVLAGGWELIQQGTLQKDVLASLKRVAVAVGFAALVGYPLGFALGGSRLFAWMFE